MIDLHVHILPGVDDGAGSVEDALEMASLAVESGVTELVVTPHSNQQGRFENFYTPRLEEKFENLKCEIAQAKIPLILHKGMEIFASDDLVEKMERRQVIGLGDSNTYLIEFPFEEDPARMGQILESVRESGRIPMIAHPERYRCVQECPDFVYHWMQMGCLTQVNRGSILGRFGRRAARTAEILLEHHFVTAVASDAHSPYMRTTYMEDIFEILKEYFGDAYATELLLENPQQILKGQKR